jgi:hypothetical protein
LVSAPIKIPMPVPFEVLLSEVVGLLLVFQQIPLIIMEDVPDEEISPPQIAEDVVILEIIEVVSVGSKVNVVNIISFPYAVPELLVA